MEQVQEQCHKIKQKAKELNFNNQQSWRGKAAEFKSRLKGFGKILTLSKRNSANIQQLFPKKRVKKREQII